MPKRISDLKFVISDSRAWLLLQSGPGEAAFNMALDEALLAAAPRLGLPVLRCYSWTEPAASFGYFQKFVEVGQRNGYHQALNIPVNTGTPVRYAGSTTGPAYNEKGSPLQVSWSVRPKVVKVSAQSVGKWCQGNMFKEDHAHGVRNLVTDPALLSPIR